MHESDIARKMDDLLFKDLGLRKEDKFYIEYGTSKDCYFDMTIEDRVESQGDCNDFEIQSGKWYGILDSLRSSDNIVILTDWKNPKVCAFIEEEFNCLENNQ